MKRIDKGRASAWLILQGLFVLLACGCSGSSGSDSGGGGGGGEGVLLVIPSSGTYEITGNAGGPFSPGNQPYVLRNSGTSALNWRAFVPAQDDWLVISPLSGTLAAGSQVTVDVSIDQAEAAKLSAGIYPVVLDFENLTNGAGTTSRGITLTVSAVAGLTVNPVEGLTSAGIVGGPFNPNTKDYTLRNTSSVPMNWSASVSEPWMTASPTSGTLAPSAQVTVTVGIDGPSSAALPLGTHIGLASFVNTTNGAGDTSRGVSLTASASGGAGTATSLTQFGITWTFDQPYPVGQFANGDWWVVGPVTITSITPGSSSASARVKNGSMINPSPTNGWTQGYDSHSYSQYRAPGSYDSNLNVALDVSLTRPLTVPPHSSLVSSISFAEVRRPQLSSGAVLTVLPSPAPAGSFRPPYCGTDKTIRFNESDLDYTELAKLAPIAGTPTLASAERYFERPWIDHVPGWVGRFVHPQDNLPDYGREIADQIGTASLLLHLNYTNAQKRDLLVGLVQVGLDLWGIVQDGGAANWQAGDGHHSGRKWPILFAGIMLSDPGMSGVGLDPSLLFMGEDGQTFVVTETSPGVYNNGFGGYQSQHAGLVDWGKKHDLRPELDNVDWWADPYRSCCTANSWWGQLLACMIMGAKPLWNHDPLFDYQDRYRVEAVTQGAQNWQISWTPFPVAMWDRYRSSY